MRSWLGTRPADGNEIPDSWTWVNTSAKSEPGSTGGSTTSVRSMSFRELQLQKLIERTEVVDPPVLPGSDFAEVLTQVHESGISFPSAGLVPSQDLIDLQENQGSTPPIQFHRQGLVPITGQGRQSNQGRLLLAGEPGWPQPIPGFLGIAPDVRNSRRGSAGSGFLVLGGIEGSQSDRWFFPPRDQIHGAALR